MARKNSAKAARKVSQGAQVPSPAGSAGSAGSAAAGGADVNLEYTVMCSFYAVGKCLRGENCKFAHDPTQIREKPNLTRTSLCHDFMRKRSCKNGDNCRYAHGEKELRQEKTQPEPSLMWDPIGLSSMSFPEGATSATKLLPLMEKLMQKRQPRPSKVNPATFHGWNQRAWRSQTLEALAMDLKLKAQIPCVESNEGSWNDPWKVVMQKNGHISCTFDSALPKSLDLPVHIQNNLDIDLDVPPYDFVRFHSMPARVA